VALDKACHETFSAKLHYPRPNGLHAVACPTEVGVFLLPRDINKTLPFSATSQERCVLAKRDGTFQ